MSNSIIIFGETACPVERGCIERAEGVKPATETFRYVNHQNGNLSMGTWDCQAGRWETASHPHHELCAIIDGEVTVTDSVGPHTFKAGDTFVIPQGTKVSWYVPQYVKKIFVIVKGMDDLDKV